MNEENTKDIRKEFAKVFDWYEHTSEYGYSLRIKILKEPSWAEIFAKIGRLQANECHCLRSITKSNGLLGEVNCVNHD